MNNRSITTAAVIAVAGILTLAVLAVAIPNHAFADDKQSTKIAIGGTGGSGGAGGAGGEGGQGGKNISEDNEKAKIDQDANGGNANGGHGGNANGGNART